MTSSPIFLQASPLRGRWWRSLPNNKVETGSNKSKGGIYTNNWIENAAEIHIANVSQKFILNSKEFSTGSVGFNGFGKMTVGDKRYQININVVEIGSKNRK